ncbi:MAG: hypothetical protein LBP39_02265, partial [Rickettsiales bacterium]|nr:hypothetical protein [Rickettsiales bacterium]
GYEESHKKNTTKGNKEYIPTRKKVIEDEEEDSIDIEPDPSKEAERETKLDESASGISKEEREEDREEEIAQKHTAAREPSESNLRKQLKNEPVAAAEEEDENGYEESHKKNTTKGNAEYIPTRKKEAEDEEDSTDIELERKITTKGRKLYELASNVKMEDRDDEREVEYSTRKVTAKGSADNRKQNKLVAYIYSENEERDLEISETD